MGTPVPGLAVSIDCNGRRVAADPYRGTVEAVLECAANLACVGAEPLGTTNNLNFGNPEKPHIAWQLTESVRGLGDACRALEAPIVGGNVSLYNEGPAGPIYPTPVVGMVGRLPDAARAGRLGFAREGDAIALVGPFAPVARRERAGEAARRAAARRAARRSTSTRCCAAQAAVRDAVRAGALRSAHDIAEGGLAVALAECCLAGGVGARSRCRPTGRARGSARDAALRRGARAASSSPDPARRSRRSADAGAAAGSSGTVGGDALTIASAGATLSATLAELAEAHGALAELFP